jgi:hypothetical protein
MKIFDSPGFPNPARIRIVLAEKKLDAHVAFEKVDLFAAVIASNTAAASRWNSRITKLSAPHQGDSPDAARSNAAYSFRDRCRRRGRAARQ